ncbi:MAG: hypothetical protein ACJAQ6_000506 [Arenicella sp.]|jgi:hypothetical protein
MKRLLKTLTFLTCLVPMFNANAGFPDDLSDVVFIESPQVRDWTVGADLNLAITGGSVILDHKPNENSKATGRWPTIKIFNVAVNANAWGIVKQDGVWMAGTWEYLKIGQTVKKLSAFRFGHFRQPVFPVDRTFNPGDVYGFFVSGTIRAGSGLNNIAERSKFVVYEVGKGVIFTEGDESPVVESEKAKTLPAIAIELLLKEPR